MSKLTPEELLRRVSDGVYALALRLTGNPADAWDLAQDALLRALRALPGFRGEADPKTWAYRITVNAWKNRVQSRGWRFWSRTLGLEAVTRAVEPPPEAELERGETAAAVARALERLAPEERAALSLRELEDRSYAEIAGILGIPVGTVKSRIHRARVLLARMLEEPDAP